MPFLNVHNEEIYDSFTVEGEWRGVLDSVLVCVRHVSQSSARSHTTRQLHSVHFCSALERQKVEK